MVVVFLQVLFRYVLGMAVPWTEEAARYLNIWMVFLGGAVAVAWDAHLKVTFFLDRLGGAVRVAVELFIVALCFGFNLIILVGSIRLIELNWNQLATTFPVSVGVLYLSVACYAALALAFGLYLFLTLASRRDDTRSSCRVLHAALFACRNAREWSCP